MIMPAMPAFYQMPKTLDDIAQSPNRQSPIIPQSAINESAMEITPPP